MKRRLGIAAILVVLPVAFLVDQAVRTLNVLSSVERERDEWQRPDDILRHLHLDPGDTIVDLGSGAGYFSLKISPHLGPSGCVLAVDLRRQSLAFLWVRAWRGGHSNLQVIRGRTDDPELPARPVDGALIANTFHELTAPEPILQALFRSMRPGASLVVVERGPHDDDERHRPRGEDHESTADVVERTVNRQGFVTVSREDHFISRPVERDFWWLIEFRKR